MRQGGRESPLMITSFGNQKPTAPHRRRPFPVLLDTLSPVGSYSSAAAHPRTTATLFSLSSSSFVSCGTQPVYGGSDTRQKRDPCPSPSLAAPRHPNRHHLSPAPFHQPRIIVITALLPTPYIVDIQDDHNSYDDLPCKQGTGVTAVRRENPRQDLQGEFSVEAKKVDG